MSADAERFAGRTAVVVGGTHGIGRALADALHAGGAAVLVTGRRGGASWMPSSDRFHVVPCDVTDLAAIDELAKEVGARLGAIDLLHVNVGFAALEPYDAVTERSYDEAFDVNAKGAFFSVQRLAPLVRDGAAIVFTSSIADEGGSPGMLAYSGAKAAVRAFAKGFAWHSTRPSPPAPA
jgi:hypothetical protein